MAVFQIKYCHKYRFSTGSQYLRKTTNFLLKLTFTNRKIQSVAHCLIGLKKSNAKKVLPIGLTHWMVSSLLPDYRSRSEIEKKGTLPTPLIIKIIIKTRVLETFRLFLVQKSCKQVCFQLFSCTKSAFKFLEHVPIKTEAARNITQFRGWN